MELDPGVQRFTFVKPGITFVNSEVVVAVAIAKVIGYE